MKLAECRHVVADERLIVLNIEIDLALDDIGQRYTRWRISLCQECTAYIKGKAIQQIVNDGLYKLR